MLALREVQLPSVIPRPSESELKKLNSKEAQFWRAHSNAYAVNYGKLMVVLSFPSHA